MMEIQEVNGSNKRVLVPPSVPLSGSSEYPYKRRLVIPAPSEPVFATRVSGRAQQQQGIASSAYGNGASRSELSCLHQERENLMIRVGVLMQECQALEVLLANSEKEKKTWSEICNNTLTSMKGLEAEIEQGKQKREQYGREAEKQHSEMQSQLLRATDDKQKILMEKNSVCEALKVKALELEKCKEDLIRLDGELADAKNDLKRAEEMAKRYEADLIQAQEAAKKREADFIQAEETGKKKEADFIQARQAAKKREIDLIQAADAAKRSESDRIQAAELAKKREVDLLRAEEVVKEREVDLIRAEEAAKKWEAELGSMTQERNKLQDLKKKLTLENKSMKQSLGELKDKTVKLEAEYGKAMVEKLSLTASLEDYKSKAEKFQTDCENIQADHQIALDKYDGEMLELICERDHCEAALIKLKSTLETLEKEHKSLQRDYEALNSLKVKEQAGLRLACEVSEKTAEKMELQLETSRAELSKLKRELNTANKQKVAVASEKTSLIQKLHTVSKELEETSFRRDSLVVECEKLIAAVSRAEKAKDSAVKELEQKLHLEATSLRKELAIAAKEKNWLAMSEASLIQKLDEATKMIRSLNEQQTESAEAIRSSKLTNHSLVQEMKSAKKRQEEIELEFFTLVQEREASRKAQCELNAEVSKLKEELQRICQEKESMSASAEASNAKVQELNALIEDLHCKLSDLNTEKNEFAKRFEQECTTVSLLRFKLTWALKEKDHIAAFANESINALVTKADSLKQQQQAMLVSGKKSSVHFNDVSMQESKSLLTILPVMKCLVHVNDDVSRMESKNLLVTLPLLEKEKDAVLPSKTEELLPSEEALKTEHNGATEVHPMKVTFNVTVKEEVEPFAESLLQQKLDYVAGTMDSLMEQIAVKVKENNGMRAELSLVETKRIQMQKTIEGEQSASIGLARQLETLKKELSGMEKRMEDAVLDRHKARNHVTDSRKECENLARKLISKEKQLTAKEKERAWLLQSRDILAKKCNSLRAALTFMEKENTDLQKELVDVRFISHHLEGEVERLRKDLLGMQKGLPCAPVFNGNVRNSTVDVQELSCTQQTVLGLPQNCDLSAQIEAMRGELACLRNENRVLNDCMNKCQLELEARRRAPGDPRRDLQVNLVSRTLLSKDSCSHKLTSEDGSTPGGTTPLDRSLRKVRSKELVQDLSALESSELSLHLAPVRRKLNVQG